MEHSINPISPIMINITKHVILENAATVNYRTRNGSISIWSGRIGVKKLSVKDQIGNSLGFVSHLFYVATTQLYHHSSKVLTIHKRMCMAMFQDNFIYTTKWWAGLGPMGRVCWDLRLATKNYLHYAVQDTNLT